ncbi:hypothetical protein RCL1_000374 [Eukaryota sp. TZLM3-RCL]
MPPSSGIDNHRTVICNNRTQNLRYGSNRVRHTKYTPFTFIFRFLFEQFSRFMNLYFLVLATLQLNPTLTPVNPITTWLPLLLTLGIAGVKEIIDDVSRWKQDRKTNNRKYFVSNGTTFSLIPSKEIRVGDVIQIRENEEFPADIVVLKSSGKGPKCHVNTSNIDGESDLKPKSVVFPTSSLSDPELARFNGQLTIPNPNPDFNSFDGIIMVGKSKYSLSSANLLHQASSLASTTFIIGVVVYVGNYTKYGLSKTKAPTKWTKIDKKINFYTACIWGTQLCLALILGTIGNIWGKNLEKHWYLFPHLPISIFLLPEFAVIPLRFLLLCSLLIPISLKVTLDVCKLIYAKFIEKDAGLRSKHGDPPVARSTAISEDLGQIEYLFADKTGTLTENKMVFKAACVGESVYQNQGLNTDCRPLVELIQSNEGLLLAKTLAMCNTVDTLFNGSSHFPLYKATSPDEKALVLAAKDMGVVLLRRSDNSVTIGLASSCLPINDASDFKGQEEYDILAVLPFSSERKRMGVLLKKRSEKDAILIEKGADDVILNLVNHSNEVALISKRIEQFAATGLRTLAIAYRHVPIAEATHFLRQLEEAQTSLAQREAKVEQVYAGLERSLTLVGATAIEDSLQENVPQTIKYLRSAGVKVIMLTGDKGSTAVQVAISCDLVHSNKGSKEGLFVLSPVTDTTSASNELSKVLKIISNSPNSASKSIVIHGVSVPTLLNPNVLPLFISVVDKLESVIACRLTPMQKAEIVSAIRGAKQATCLAIGDGGNDVSMILAANVGVGIQGREGLAAAGAADYAISQFSHLKKLMVVHGRQSLRRTAFVTLFSFWKSMIIAFQQLSFGFFTMFSGTSFFDTFALSTWNIIFTSWPVLLYVLDKDYADETVSRRPDLYKSNLVNDIMSPRVFISWVIKALWQAIVCFSVTLLAFNGSYHHSVVGVTGDYYSAPLVSFTALMIIHTITIIIESNKITGWNSFFIFGSLVVLPLTLMLFRASPTSDLFDLQFRLFRDPIYYVTLLVTCLVALLPPVVYKWYGTLRKNELRK